MITVRVCVCVRLSEYVCLCVERLEGGAKRVWRAARWRLQGQLRDQPLSGNPHHPATSCLSMNKSGMGARSIGLSACSTPYDT